MGRLRLCQPAVSNKQSVIGLTQECLCVYTYRYVIFNHLLYDLFACMHNDSELSYSIVSPAHRLCPRANRWALPYNYDAIFMRVASSPVRILSLPFRGFANFVLSTLPQLVSCMHEYNESACGGV